ncbi:MAG: hypothetical protein NZ528_14895 [Caldilineales bacterium]|nr:hypothetical protein [Caldilineales bacterium]MDW8317470.1 hypothetical protein [Anaerolineae bacterium]
MPLFTALPSAIRYLLVWRIQGRLVRLPPYLPVQISTTVAALVAERLPTQQAKPWQKAIAAAQQAAAGGEPATAAWPIESVIFVPPGKRTYGEGEPIVWELKLLGAHADHGLFLEVLLPAIEAAGVTRDPRWFSNYSLWGRFVVQAVYVANGAEWQPLAEEGRLNLRLRPTTSQWANRLWSSAEPALKPRRLRWITPFALPLAETTVPPNPSDSAVTASAAQPPALTDLVAALLSRLAQLQTGRRALNSGAWGWLEAQERDALQALLADAPAVSQHTLAAPPAGWPGRWIGDQRWAAPIPAPLLPYLDLAAILHIGDHTHYGCGTFRLS